MFPFRAPQRAFALLAYLVLHAGDLNRERVAFELWPDVAEDQARTKLRHHLHLLQTALPPGVAWIRSDRRAVAWNGGEHASADVEAFDELSTCDEAAAVAQYRGELLTGFDDEWIEPLRNGYRERCAGLLRRLFRRSRERCDPAAATEYGMCLLRLDPLREDVVRDLMEVRSDAGDRAGAARLYAELVTRLRDELGVEPAAETQRAYAAVIAESRPPARANDTRSPQRLALPTTSFHGRDRDVKALRDFLRAHRLVTLVGPGGVGKTRLAIETAARLAESFEGGAHVVDLAPLESSVLVAERAAQTLRIREAPGFTARQALVAELRDRDILLIFDNCEHVLDDAAQVAEMVVRSTSGVRVLVTSREPLRIADETVYRVPPLHIATGHDLARDELLQTPAVQLFIDRALARDHTLDLAPHAATIAAICARLDGLPLAIELAAVNLSGTTVPALAAAIEARFDELGEGWRTSAPRHRTLQAVFAWSFQLLNDPLRELFLRLAVFRGSFSVKAAHAVGIDGLNAGMVRQLLGALREQSLLTAEHAGNELRYRMLETTRAFAGEMLAENGSAPIVERSHSAFFAAEAQGARVAYETMPDAEWLPFVRADLDNYGAALERTLGASREPALGAAIAAGLTDLWLTAGQDSVAARWLEMATEHDPDSIHAWIGLAAVYRRGYRFPAAIAAAERVLPRLRGSDDCVTLCKALMIAGNSLVSSASSGDRETAERGRAMVLESLHIAQARGLVLRMAEARFALGIVNDYFGDLATALAEFETAERLFASIGKLERRENALLSIAHVAYLLGDRDRASAIGAELTSEGRAFNRVQMAYGFELLGTVAFDRQDLPLARSQMERALALVTETGLEPIVNARLARIACIDAAVGSAVAVRLFGYLRRCEESGTLSRHPRDREADVTVLARLRKLHEPRFACLWQEGYQATQAEVLAMVFARDGEGDAGSGSARC